MPELPKNAKNLAGFEPYGVDANGQYVFFGFKAENSEPVNIQCNHRMLGETIRYLQSLATEARSRRTAIDPSALDLDVRESQTNPVQQINFETDIMGQSIAIRCTTQDGVTSELQMPVDMIEQMHAKLPELLAVAQDRRRAHKKQH
jgi:hypothetical protein